MLYYLIVSYLICTRSKSKKMDYIQWGLKISMNSIVLCTTVILKRMCLFDIYIYIYIYSSSFI